MSAICQTCSSELLPSPSPPYLTGCCSTAICGPCLARNPRLREHVPCLRCGDVRTAAGNARVQRGRLEVDRRREERERGMFEIGEDEEDPPSYDTIANECKKGDEDRALADDQHGDGAEDREGEMEVVEVKHPVSRSDTLLGIARKYAADPHDLLTLNNLPPSTLSSQPHLLRTRRTLLISRRLVPKSSLPDTIIFPAPASEIEVDPEEAARREKERQVKRFQLMTKTVDPGVGAAYIGLSELSEGRDVLDEGSGEALEKGGGGGKGKKVWKEEGNRTERALEAFFEDEGWEREVGGPERTERRGGLGKWKSVGGVSDGVGIKT